METTFDHEKLRAYQEALKFSAWVDPVLERIPSRMAARDQLDRASTSIVLNIAEGNGKRSHPDRCRYLDIARGSTVECAACLDVLVVRNKLTLAEANEGKTILLAVVLLVSGLIARFSSRDGLVAEEPSEYRTSDPIQSEENEQE